MPHYPLLPHPTSTPVLTTLEVTLAQRAGVLDLCYRLQGDIQNLCIPDVKAPKGHPTDGLWQHTCFECFLGLEGGAYLEFNFSPSGDWAAYRFSDYRKLEGPFFIDPQIRCERGSDGFELFVHVESPLIPKHGHLQLSAVLEDTSGTISYWAIQHPKGKPDFHVQCAWTV